MKHRTFSLKAIVSGMKRLIRTVAGRNWPSAEDWRKNERRQYWLWATAIFISILLTLTASSLAFALLHAEGEVFYFLETRQAVDGLLGLVLLFDVYVIYQQVQNRRISQMLTEQYEIFKVIGQNAADMIAVVDIEGHRLYNSPSYQQVLGYSPEELASTGSLDQIHPDDRRLVQEAAKQACQGGKGKSLEYRFRHKDGSWRILESTASVVRNASEKPEKLVIINRDITERRQAEEEARQTHFRQARKMEALGRLSGGIAHDFNNLLGVILGYVEALQTPAAGNIRNKSVQEIKKAAQRGASLTRQLLAFSRQQVLAPKVLDLNVVVSEVDAMLRRLIGEDIELLLHRDQSLGHVMADQGQIEQVILNLAVNARDAMPSGGKLSIGTSNVELDKSLASKLPMISPGRYVRISISDTGVGMSAEIQAHIFEPFFTTKPLGRGTGMGLATVYGIVKQSNGFIYVESKVGKGTRFEVYFPQVERAVQTLQTKGHQVEVSHLGKSILLVEDEDALREVTRDLLLQAGFEVLDAHDGKQALEIAHRNSGTIDLLLTDVIMPGIHGPAMAEQLVRAHAETKVLYMSGYTDHIIAQHGLASGIHLLEKPFTRDKLLEEVRTALDSPAPIAPKRFSKPRRSLRMYLLIRVRVERQAADGKTSLEDTETYVINEHGALIRLLARPQLQERLTLQNASTRETQAAKVVYISEAKDGTFNTGIEFDTPCPSFWGVTFPCRSDSSDLADANPQNEWSSLELQEAGSVGSR